MSLWPQITYLTLITFSLGINISKGTDIGTTLVAAGIVNSILYWGGFFDVLMR